MSSQDTTQQGSQAMPGAGPHDYPVCHRCSRRMTVKQLTPAIATKADDIVYTCRDCGTSATRTVARG